MKLQSNQAALSAVILAASMLFLTACNEGPYVEVDGKKYDESDLKKLSPSSYKAMRDEYNQQLVNALSQVATDKLLELEAEKLGKSKDEYMNSLREKIKAPTEAEKQAMYAQLKGSGQITTESYGEVSDRIAQFMMGRSQQDVVQAEITRLKKEYGYRVFSGPIVRQDVAIDDDPARSEGDAKVTIIEFSDFECPYCTKVQQTATKLRATYGDKIKWVVKDFPLSFHENAMAAHVAANCVLLQDKTKYWNFFDGLFAVDRSPNYLHPDELANLAARVGANMQDYSLCISNSAVMEAEVKADIAQGEGVGVRGTPAFFINGRFVSGALPYEDFDAIIQEELN